MGLTPAAAGAGISARTARKWLKRFEALGDAGLVDHSSRPHKTRSTMDEEMRGRIERLRRARMPMRTIARIVGHSTATVSRFLATLGLSSLKALEPAKPIVRTQRTGRDAASGHQKFGASCAPVTESPATAEIQWMGPAGKWPT